MKGPLNRSASLPFVMPRGFDFIDCATAGTRFMHQSFWSESSSSALLRRSLLCFGVPSREYYHPAVADMLEAALCLLRPPEEID